MSVRRLGVAIISTNYVSEVHSKRTTNYLFQTHNKYIVVVIGWNVIRLSKWSQNPQMRHWGYMRHNYDTGAALPQVNSSPARKFVTQPPTSTRTFRASLRLRNVTSSQNSMPRRIEGWLVASRQSTPRWQGGPKHFNNLPFQTKTWNKEQLLTWE